jgi:hypothetical protein
MLRRSRMNFARERKVRQINPQKIHWWISHRVTESEKSCLCRNTSYSQILTTGIFSLLMAKPVFMPRDHPFQRW